MVYARPKNAIPYSSVREFFEVNPACCTFVRSESEGSRPALLAYLLGDEWRIVRVSYLVRYGDERGNPQSRLFTEYVMLGRDGKVVWVH